MEVLNPSPVAINKKVVIEDFNRTGINAMKTQLLFHKKWYAQACRQLMHQGLL